MEPQFVIDVVIIIAIYHITINGIKCLLNTWINSFEDNTELQDLDIEDK